MKGKRKLLKHSLNYSNILPAGANSTWKEIYFLCWIFASIPFLIIIEYLHTSLKCFNACFHIWLHNYVKKANMTTPILNTRKLKHSEFKCCYIMFTECWWHNLRKCRAFFAFFSVWLFCLIFFKVHWGRDWAKYSSFI